MIGSRLAAAIGALALTVSALVAGSGAAGASAATSGGSDPTWNIPELHPVSGSVCESQPTAQPCADLLLANLQHARSVMGLPAYSIPALFSGLSAQTKLLLLADEDRTAYSLTRIAGRVVELDSAAHDGVTSRSDPVPPATLGGQHWTLWASNWAGGTGPMQNPLYAYYLWMYADGLNPDGTSNNLDCTPAHPSGCWGHRHNVLVTIASGQKLLVGMAGGADGQGAYGWTQLFTAFPVSTVVHYVPSIIRLSTHSVQGSTGGRVTLYGYGFNWIQGVAVVGAPAAIVSRNVWTMTISAPKHAPASGHVVVRTTGASSFVSSVTAFTYT